MSAECQHCGADLLADLSCPECRYAHELAAVLGLPADTSWERLLDEVSGVRTVLDHEVDHPFPMPPGRVLGMRTEFDDAGKVTRIRIVMEKPR